MKIALITGTSTGIGLETAIAFARRGYEVFAGARRPGQSAGLQDAVAAGLPIVPVVLDVDRDESVRAAVAEVLAAAGAVDVLVNNAGIGLSGPVEMVPLDQVRALFETNFYGAIRMIQAVLPGMRRRRSGTIVNVTSMMGRMTFGCHGFYCATKYALAAATEALAVEVKPFGLKVALIEPGVILTPMWDKGAMVVPAEHPYNPPWRRLFRFFGSQMEGGTLPDAVASEIVRVTEADAPRLHNPVGADAEAMIAGRERISADEWVDLQAEPDKDRFASRAEQVFGADLYHRPSLNQRRLDAAAKTSA